MPKNTKTQNPVQSKSHKVRTFFSAIAGIIAIYLILASVTVVWLNQTLTNTNTYVNTVAPLVKKPAIQSFIAQKVSDQIINNAPTQNLATTLLPASELSANQTPSQIKSMLSPVIQSDVLQIVKSNSFATLWKNTNQTANAELVSQLNGNSGQVQLDLSPAVNGVINELKASQLSPVANKISISPNTGKLDIKNSGVSKVHHYYKLFQAGTIAIVVCAVLAVLLSILLSIHHAKTIRRILVGVGILALLQALALEAPRYITTKGMDQVTQNAVRAFAEAIFHNLQLANLILGIVCILGAIGSKVYVKYRH